MNEKVIVSIKDIDYWEPNGKIKEYKIEPYIHAPDVPSNYSFINIKGKVIEDMLFRGASNNRIKRLKDINSLDDLGYYMQNECSFYGHFEYRNTKDIMNIFIYRYNKDSLEIRRLEEYKSQYPEGNKFRPLLDQRIDERKRHRIECLNTYNLLKNYLG